MKIEILISINYLFIIKKDLINLPSLIAFNIHGSLLPKYRGRTPHVWAIINNELSTGVTAHLIDEGCDTGDIIDQIALVINEKDTGNDILSKFGNLYIKIIDNVLKKAENKNLIYIKQNESHATYFGKRTPEDGLIDWNWQKERIRNWVRALKEPYPGAFFVNVLGDKVIINKVKFNDLGFQNSIRNGTVLSLNPLLVKTPNGVIELILKAQDETIFTGQILNK